jgi:hypothetical protein
MNGDTNLAPSDRPSHCPECGAAWSEGLLCQDYFHQMLAWEIENPPLGEVHHLTVLCYYLQHPGLYSPEGLAGAKRLLADFLVRGLSPGQVRRRDRTALDSGKRKYRIAGSPDAHGAYTRPILWTLTAADVVAGGPNAYRDNVRAWAHSILEALQSSGYLP